MGAAAPPPPAAAAPMESASEMPQTADSGRPRSLAIAARGVIALTHKVSTFTETEQRPPEPDPDATKRFWRLSAPAGIDSLLGLRGPDQRKTNSLIHANDFHCNHLGACVRNRGRTTNHVSSASH